ncbi:MAG: ABC transporter permease [Deltaproteobacteria bacterium]|nr:ABC transporter permease [Deltaproteobacteria bacterium]
MRAYLVHRLVWLLPTFFGITLLSFALLHLAPGDPLSAAGADTLSGAGPSQEAIADFRSTMGLDQPLPARYAKWLGRVLTLDFGLSSYDHRPVADKVLEALPNTLLLSGLALLLSYLLAIPLGVLSAVKRGSWFDRALGLGLFLLYSMPAFWVAVMLLVLFGGGRYWNLFPMQGLHSPGAASLGPLGRLADLAWHLVLPVFCLTYASLAALSRYARASMVEALRQDYVRTARAKGLGEPAVVLRHALRNALLPIVTLLGLSLPHLVGGSVIVEQIFGVPGMGRLGFQALATRDYNTVMAVTTLAALLTMLGGLVSDLACSALDPRIRKP